MRREEGTREKAVSPRKEVGGVRATTTAAASSGLGLRSWLGLKDPRIVRVSRSFGGKDRHSKVSTVKGLRDRRVRLSVQTAIQLYDLQDRLGLSQPSKVVDWLLDATQHEIDKLPPLQMPPAGDLGVQLAQAHHDRHHRQDLVDVSSTLKILTGAATDASAGDGDRVYGSADHAVRRNLMLSNNNHNHSGGDVHHQAGRRKQMNMEEEDEQQQHHSCDGVAVEPHRGLLLANGFLFPNNAAGTYAAYFHLEPPPSAEAGASSNTSGYPGPMMSGTTTPSPQATSLSLMPAGHQLLLCPSGSSPSMASVQSNNHVTNTTAPADYGSKHVDYLSVHNASSAAQNFFSGSLFASFPPAIPTSPYIPK